LGASRNIGSVTNSYLNTDEVATNVSPLVLPTGATLVAMSLSAGAAATWTAEVHLGGVLVVGASLASGGAASAYATGYSVAFSAGNGVQIYCNGSSINRPRVILWFKRS
jgi:hypothetical protein